MPNRPYKVAIFLLTLAMSLSSVAQNTQVLFGQNRVQFHDFEWLYYDSDNFTTYFYQGGQEIGEFVIVAAEEELKKLEEELDFSAGGRISIIVYNDITDLAQTNIGLGSEAYNLGGTTHIYGNKMFLYFDGSHDKLVKELKKGIATIFIHSALTGNFFQEIMNNTAFFSIPDWFEKGIASYIGERWSVENDEMLRDYILNDKKGTFANLVRTNPELAGHSIWYFLDEVYGKEAIRNVLYLSRINRSVNAGMKYATGISLENAEIEWKQFFYSQFKSDVSNRQTDLQSHKIKIKTRKNRSFSHVTISPDGKQLAYAVFNGGAFKVMVQNLENNKAHKVLKGGFLSDNYPFDQSYPILSWTPTGYTLGSIYEKKDKIFLNEWDKESGKKTKTEIKGFQRVNDFSYTTDNKNIVMAVQLKGQSDIYTLNLNNMNTKAITNDIWDDATPAYIHSGDMEGFVFASNRPDDTLRNQPLQDQLPLGKYDLFFKGLNNSTNTLDRLTSTSITNEVKPVQFDNDHFLYLSEQNGFYNQYLARLDSVFLGKDSVNIDYDEMAKDDFGNPLPGETEKKKQIDVYKVITHAVPVSDVPNNLQEHSVSTLTGQSAVLYKKDQRTQISIIPIDSASFVNILANTAYQRDLNKRESSRQAFEEKNAGNGIPFVSPGKASLDSLLSGDFPFLFNSDFDNTVSAIRPEEVKPETEGDLSISDSKTTTQKIENRFRSSQTVAYRAKLSSDYVVTQIDNSILLQPYQNFDVNGGAFKYPDLSGMITFGISDLMEDHKIVGGFRIPINFDGSQVFVSYQNLKKRYDYRLLFYRNSYQEDLVYNPTGTNILLPMVGKIKSHYAEASVSYPFDIIRSLKLIGGFRNDRRFIAITDPISASLPNTNQNWASLHLEYVYDNTKEIQLNILNGLRYKAYFEYMRSFEDKKGNLYNVGFDVRHYQKIYRNIIWANRFAAASSFGPRKIAYIMGGVDTWLNPDYNSNIPIDNNNGYALQAPVNNLRGLPQNIRNGNSFFLWNSEIRFPIFSAFAKKTLRSSFLQNLQLVGFFDLGSAYKGFTPFDEQNPINTEQIVYQAGGVPVTVINVEYFRKPTVYGYGAGVHTSLLGYFLRVDAAWGFDGTSRTTKPKWMFSLSKDF